MSISRINKAMEARRIDYTPKKLIEYPTVLCRVPKRGKKLGVHIKRLKHRWSYEIIGVGIVSKGILPYDLDSDYLDAV